MNSIGLAKKHEGLRLDLYMDPLGVPTIGYGTNITTITQKEADFLFLERFRASKKEAQSFRFYNKLNDVRQAVVENMIYNMGLSRFSGFKKMIEALNQAEYKEAAKQMLYASDGVSLSPWAQQVGTRATDLALMMETGTWKG